MRAAGLALVLSLLAPGTARARDPSLFFLIVGNNRSSALSRPTLQYADDDAVRYYELFATLAPEENLFLLTDLDRDTRGLYPQLIERARPPTRGGVRGTAQAIAAAVAERRARGEPSTLYFVFAGHGDVDRGRGFLELADGPFTADDLEALLVSVSATRAHVILDSCNSFFVVNPRKPGGHRFATPADAAKTLGARLPRVGVFLATSAEAEVFEWSELQSGVFSHAVRSGLAGAADANHDSVVTYEELAAFVELAAADVKNPLYRPKVFARGPSGEDGSTLVDLSRSEAVRLDADGPAVRFTVRDAAGIPWIDAHKEDGVPMSVRIPDRVAGGAFVERLAAVDGVSRVDTRLDVGAPHGPTSVALATLPPAKGASLGRGAIEAFRGLFARPFGPRALAAYEEEKRSEPPPVYGISRDDEERMRLLLSELADGKRTQRRLGAAAFASMGVGSALVGGFTLADAAQSRADSIAWLTAGAGFVGLATWLALSASEGEGVRAEFDKAMASGKADLGAVVAATELRLASLEEQEHRARLWGTVAGAVMTAVGVGSLAATLADGSSRPEQRMSKRAEAFGTISIGAVMVLTSLFTRQQTEEIIELWRRDPGLQKIPSVSLAPVRGGALVRVGVALE